MRVDLQVLTGTEWHGLVQRLAPVRASFAFLEVGPRYRVYRHGYRLSHHGDQIARALGRIPQVRPENC